MGPVSAYDTPESQNAGEVLSRGAGEQDEVVRDIVDAGVR